MAIRSTIKKTDKKNKGGLAGGVAYTTGSAVAGLAGVGEGIIDLGLATAADITGNHEFAEYVFKDNVVGDWHEDLAEEFNPGTGWKFAGDVAHGLGQSSWFLLSMIPGAQWLGPAVFGTGMVGQGISSAAEQTGDVGFKEVAYGVTTAALETGLEYALGGMGKVAKAGAGAIAKETGKQTLRSIASSSVRKGLASKLFSDAAGEFAEEFVSELADTALQRAYQINPEAEYSLQNALYAGAVGAVSGGISAGSVDVTNTVANRARGAKIVKNGNAQTLVNTANLVADKLAASGTNFKKAPEWVKTLRGEVDAYNKLVSKGQQNSASAETILGEMKVSLYFAETQAIHSELVKKIQNESEENRAALAEYINRSIDKTKRRRDYTAADIAADTDEIATQLGIMNMAGSSFFNFESAMADQAQESGIESVIAEERGKDTTGQSGAEGVQSAEGRVQSEAEAAPISDEAFAAARARAVDTVQSDLASQGPIKYELKKDSSGNTYVDVDESLIKDTDSPKQIAQTLSDVVRNKFKDFVDVKGQKIGINQRTANEWVKSKSADSLRKYDNQKFLDKANAFGNADELLQAARDYIGEEIKHARKDNFVEFARGVVDFKVGNNGYSADIIVGTTKSGAAVLYDIVNIQGKEIAADTSYTAQDRRSNASTAINNSIPQNESIVNTESEKNITKHDLTEKGEGEKPKIRSTLKKRVQAEDNGTSRAPSPTGGPESESATESRGTKASEPKVSEAKESLTDEQRKEKARKRAEAWLEWEKKTAPTAKELNTAREYVKEFDNLSNPRRLAIIRMIRSADGKVDKKILKGVANLMAVNPLSDLEIRFAEGLGGDKGGFVTKIGNKTVIVIDSSTDFKNTIQGTIAHELVHYLENKAGYKEFAAFVRKHAKPEAVERHRKRYTDFYRELITAQLMRGEGEVSGKYDIVVLENGNTYVTASRKIINGKTLSEKRRDISDFFTTLLNEKSSLDIQTIEGDILTITKSETADKARDNYKYVNGKRVKLADDEFIVKLHAEAHIDELAETSLKSPKSPSGDEKNHSFAKDGFTYRTAYFEDFDGQYYQVTLSVGHNGTVATVYNVGKIKESVPSSAKIIAVVGSRALDKTLSDNIISQKHDIVNPSEEKSQQNKLSKDEKIPEDIKVRVEERLASAEIQELIESEITAKLAGQALNNERFLKRYADRDKKFIQKAFEWMKERVTRLKKNGKDTEEVSEVADEMAHRLIVLLQTKETTGESNGSKKYSFAGEKAKTADKMKLATAKEMLEGGVDSETVRKETGWFKSYDGKWRFEINDEEMKVSVPTSEHAKVGDIVDHPLLFEAYPELKETKIRFDDGLSDATAIFYPQFDEIVLTGLLKKYPQLLKETLIHEMQHVVQELEGFAKGSSPEYWLKARRDAQLKYDSLKKDLDQWLTDIGYERFAEEIKARFLAGEISPKESAKALEDFFKNPLYAEELARREAELDKLNKDRPKLHQVGDGLGIATVKDMYYATAGEIEARDAARRGEFTDAQRKIIRPEVDWKHAVFAEDGVSYYAAKDKSAENDSVKTQLREHLNEVNTMEPVANVKYHVVNKEKAKQDTKDFYKSKGSKIDRQNFGIIEMGEREVELSSNYANTAAEFAAWQTIPSVLKRGRLISGHENHKNEGFPTYTFAAPVVINGQRGNVAVVVRKTGKYRYKMHRILMPDGSVFVYKDINENAELTGSDILLNEKEKGPDISSASTNSIPQKSDLSTHSAKKYDLADDIHNENGEVFEKKKILPGMSDTERYEILENRIIENVPSAKEISTEMLQKIPEISSWEDINRYFKSDKKKLITKIAKEFGAIGKEFSNEDIGISFYFSGNNFQESYGKQKKNYIAFAKMFSVFDDVVQRAVGIEIHNRNDIGYKYDPTLENMYVLVSAYQDGEHIIPVKLEVKEFNDKQNTLYVAISLEKIKKTEVSEQGTTDNGVAQGSRSVNISISQLFEKINPSDKSFLKYVPKDFLNKQNDADVTAIKKIKYDLADDIHNENGEVKNEFFEAAVLRSLGTESSDSEALTESRRERAERMIETRKTRFNKLLRRAATIQRKLEKLKTAADKSANAAEVKNLSKEYREIIMQLEDLQRELREMGYDLNTESRLIEQQKKQIKAQGEVIADLRRQKRELEELEREDRIMRELDKREAARAAKKVAELRAEIGKVYSNTEVRKYIDEIFERGLISQFFGGQYRPELSPKIKNEIAQYIAMQLNLLGTSEGKRANNIIFAATNDIVKRVTFTDAESGEKYYLDKLVDEDTAKQFAEVIEGDLITMFRDIGELNPYAEIIRRYKLVEDEYLEKGKAAKEMTELGKELPKTYQAALKIRKMSQQGKGTYSQSVQKIVNELGKIVDESGHLHFGKIDTAMREASVFLEAEVLKSESEAKIKVGEGEEISQIDKVEIMRLEAMKNQVDELLRLRKGRDGQAFTSEEMKMLGDVLRNMKTTVERHNKEVINGHLTDIDKAVSGGVRALRGVIDSTDKKEYKTKIGKVLGSKVGNKVNEFYFYKILSPETVISAIEGFADGGLLGSMYHTIRLAQAKSNTMATRMLKPFDDFFNDKENRWEGTGEEGEGGIKGWKYSYRDKLNVKKVNLNGFEMTLGEGINLFMLTKRKEAHAGLVEGGYIVFNNDGKSRTVKVEDIDRAREFLYNQFDEADRKFVRMAEEFFNVTASKIKYDADMKIFGFSNNVDGYYVPMVRDRYARMKGVTDARFSIGETVSLYAPSFTKNLVANANGLEGTNIMLLIERHARGLADFSELYLPLKAFDRVYNRGVSTESGVTSIRKILNDEVWTGTDEYFKDLFKDIQHQSEMRSDGIDKMVGWMRSRWVNSVLGANVKVIATQTTSLGAATQMIEPRFITQATWLITPSVKVDEIRARAYKFSNVIEARAFDMEPLKAQGNIDKITRVGEISGLGIGWMDERVTLAIYHAAELKVQAQTGEAVGTEANAKRAARIADETILATQSMSEATEKSALQRSKSEIGKLFSMFTSDSVKNLSHFYGNIMKYQAHKALADAGDTKYAEMLKQDKADLLRSTRTLAITGIMLGLISQAFKYLYAKEEEEPEDKAKDLAIDLVSSTLNIFPGVSDVVDKLVFDYDMSMNVLDVANDTLETFAKGMKTAGKAMSGEYVSAQDAAGVSVDIIKSSASFVGIPVSPVERTVTGLIRRVAPSAIYGYDSLFYNPSYTADLKTAVESGDEALAEHILDQLYKSEVNGTYTSAELEEIVRLYSLTDEDGKHYNVLPQKIGTEVNGVKLSSAQRKKFMSIYSGASAEVNKLIGSSYYTMLADEQRAKAIKNIYSMYYDRAAAEVAGKEWSNAVAYSYLTSNYTVLFAAQAYKSGLSEEKDASGKKITVGAQFVEYAKNLGLSESDYVVITYANGIRNKENKAALIRYINSLSLSADVKAQIAERLGFEVKDGVVVEKVE